MKLNYFNYKNFSGKVLLTNDMGRYIFVEEKDFRQLIAQTIRLDSSVGEGLKKAGMVYTCSDLEFVENSENCLRDVKGHVATATSLHIFVVTTSCNMNCLYCQANNGTTVPNIFMTRDIAERAVDIALQSPEYQLSFEFQGGEPLLNYPVIEHIIKYAEEHQGNHEIEFNLVSNLTLMTDEMLDFFAEHHCNLSTSVDGAKPVHDRNRPYRSMSGTFDDVVKKVEAIKNKGMSIGAIETTTRYTLNNPTEMVHTYTDIGFDSIFIRHLTQLGKAKRKWDEIGYSAEEFLDFYRKAIN